MNEQFLAKRCQLLLKIPFSHFLQIKYSIPIFCSGEKKTCLRSRIPGKKFHQHIFSIESVKWHLKCADKKKLNIKRTQFFCAVLFYLKCLDIKLIFSTYSACLEIIRVIDWVWFAANSAGLHTVWMSDTGSSSDDLVLAGGQIEFSIGNSSISMINGLK